MLSTCQYSLTLRCSNSLLFLFPLSIFLLRSYDLCTSGWRSVLRGRWRSMDTITREIEHQSIEWWYVERFLPIFIENTILRHFNHIHFWIRSGYEWKIANVNRSNWRYFYYINVHDINKNFKFNSNFYIQNYFYNGKKTKI